MPAARRVLLLNPNTNRAVTARMLAHARGFLPPGLAAEALTASAGPAYVSNRAEAAIAARTVAEAAVRLVADPPDALVVACFGDPGLDEARRALACPVIGMAEASCLVARQLGRRFAIVTGGREWGPMLEEFAAARGLAAGLAAVETVEATGDRIAADPAGAAAEIAAAAARVAARGAEVVILGGAGMVGLRPLVAPLVPARIVDSLECALAQAAALLALDDAPPIGGNAQTGETLDPIREGAGRKARIARQAPRDEMGL